MITLDLHHLFKTDPNNNFIPKVVYDWVTEKNAKYPIEYKISFDPYKVDEHKQFYTQYEQLFTGGLGVSEVLFPLAEGVWRVRLIGAKLADGSLIPFTDIDNHNHETSTALGRERLVISGLLELLEKENSPIEIVHDGAKATRGFKRTQPLTDIETEMVAVKAERNINDEWEFRGTGQEFMDEKVTPILEEQFLRGDDEKSSP